MYIYDGSLIRFEIIRFRSYFETWFCVLRKVPFILLIYAIESLN